MQNFIENKEEIEGNKRIKEYCFSLFKKLSFIIFFLFIVNFLINFISYKFGFFNDDFKYRFDTSKAVSLNLKDKNLIRIFYKKEFFYFLFEEKGKYYLVKQKDNTLKEDVLTLYSKFYLNDIFNELVDKKEFINIVDNISPTLYEEVSTLDFIFKPLWFSNSINRIYWSNYENKQIKQKYYDLQKLKAKKVLNKKKQKYRNLLNKDLEKLSIKELQELKKELYSFYAYTKDTKYVLSIFKELEKRGEKKFDRFQLRLMSYLHLFRAKEKLNEILLKNYNMGVVYTFKFWDNQPLDIPLQKKSHLRLSNLKTKTKILLFKDKIKEIKVVDNKILISYKNAQSLSLDNFEAKDIKSISIYLNRLIDTIAFIEKEFNSIKTLR